MIKNNLLFLFSAALVMACTSKNDTNFGVLPEGIVVIEAESTPSDLGKWIKKVPGDTNYISNAGGETHIEFTGNTKNGGAPDSPLEYGFTVPYSGTYGLLIRCHKRLEGEPGDKCNDGWIKLEGNFTSGNDIPVEDLKGDIKLFGGSSIGWGWAQKYDWQGHIKRFALYNFTEGEQYKLINSGRSIRWNVDCYVLYDTAKFHRDSVKLMIDPKSLSIDETPSKWNLEIEGFVPAYYDKQRKAFAVNTVKQPADEWAAAEHRFHKKDGIYDVEFTSLLETDGECSYKVFVDSVELLSFTNPRIHGTDSNEYAPYAQTIQNVALKRGSIIRIEFLSHSNGLVPENDAYGYARARWRDIKITRAENN